MNWAILISGQQIMSDKLFVYGTLRDGYPLHKHLQHRSIRLLGRGWISGQLFDLGEFPGAIPSDSPGHRVKGEVYELSDPSKHLQEIDVLEEFEPQRPERSLFIRRLTEVELDSGKPVKAWAYFLSRRPNSARLIASGDYLMVGRDSSTGRGQMRKKSVVKAAR